MKDEVQKILGEKFVGLLALTLTLSPRERGQQLCDCLFANANSTDPAVDLRVGRRAFLPLLGERAGVRANVLTHFLLIVSCT